MPEVEPVTPLVSASSEPDGVGGLFAAAHCEQIDFRYRVTRDTFAVQRFLAFFDEESEEKAQGKAVICRTLQPDKLDYHIHFRWQFSKEFVTFYVSFHSGVYPSTENEREPYAERFMSWFGEFFSNETAHADLHSEFEYPPVTRQSRFPLPLTTYISDLEAEINGISLSFVSIPGGITGAKIQQGQKRLNIELLGATRTNFATFDLQSEVSRLSSLALRLTEARDIK